MIAANAQVGVAEAARLPSINLNASLASVAADTSDLFTDNARAWGLGASIVGPLLDFGRTRANIESAEARVEQADAQYRLTVLTAFNEVRDALNHYALTGERVEAVNLQIAAVERARDLAVLTYDQDQTSMLERLDAERSLLSARLDRADVQSERLAAGHPVQGPGRRLGRPLDDLLAIKTHPWGRFGGPHFHTPIAPDSRHSSRA